jgi:hypothetical protein
MTRNQFSNICLLTNTIINIATNIEIINIHDNILSLLNLSFNMKIIPQINIMIVMIDPNSNTIFKYGIQSMSVLNEGSNNILLTRNIIEMINTIPGIVINEKIIKSDMLFMLVAIHNAILGRVTNIGNTANKTKISIKIMQSI